MSDDTNVASEELVVTNTSKRAVIEAGIISGRDHLLRGIRIYMSRLGLSEYVDSIQQETDDIFSETVVAALESADRYDPARPLNAWLLGIAINKIKSRLRQVTQERKRILSFSEYQNSQQDEPALTEEEWLDQLHVTGQTIRGESLNDLLSLVNEDDSQVLELAFVHGIKGKNLAERLGISPGAAYLRLHRAIKRLRTVYFQEEE